MKMTKSGPGRSAASTAEAGFKTKTEPIGEIFLAGIKRRGDRVDK
jgi:hypothetical protein